MNKIQGMRRKDDARIRIVFFEQLSVCISHTSRRRVNTYYLTLHNTGSTSQGMIQAILVFILNLNYIEMSLSSLGLLHNNNVLLLHRLVS